MLFRSRALADRLSAHGMTVWSLEYRRLGDPGGGLPGTFDDIETATESLRLLHGHGVSTDKVIIAGHSAGGHLALWAAARHPGRFNGVLGLAAITDLARYAAGDSDCEQSARQLIGAPPTEAPDIYRNHSPSEMAQHPQTFLVQALRDSIVPVHQAKALNLPEARLTYTEGGHFDLIHPDTADFQVVLELLQGLVE